MTAVAFSLGLFNFIAYVLFYFLTAFGSGLVIGFIISNIVKGRGNPTYMQLYREGAKAAAEHNSQWNPANERWRKN